MRRTVFPPRRFFAALWSAGLWPFLILTGCAALAWGQSSSTAEALAARIGAINREMQAAAPAEGTSGRLANLLEERAALLSKLIGVDPAGALESALQLQIERPSLALETRGQWNGTIEAVISDDFAGARSRTSWYLNTGQERVEMFFAGEPPRRPGIHVSAEGMRLGNRLAVAEFKEAAPNSAPSSTALSCTTIGPQNIAVLMLTMPSNRVFPPAYTKASLQDAFFGSPTDTGDAQSLNGYWKEMSYGLTSTAGQVFGPFALSQDYDYDTQSALETAAINAADSTVDFTQFTRIALIFPIQSWGGWAADDSIGCWTVSSPSKGNLPESIGWLPAFPNATPPVGIYAHELGHGLGLNHSSSDDYGAAPLGPLDESGTLTEYGNPFATMGPNQGQYVAEHKSLILHWLNPGDYQEVISAGSFTVRALESTANPRGLRVLRDPLSSAWLWIEYRQPIGAVDTILQNNYGNLPFAGALVNYEDPNLNSPWHTYLLDFNPVSTPNDFTRSALTPGSSWSDSYSPLTLSVGSPADGGLPVTVSYDQPCASLQYSATTFPASGGSGTITVSAPNNCAWSASSASAWIGFPGGTSGSGNGSVTFSVAANSGSNQQSGYIAVQRQSTRIIEKGTRWSALSVSPSFGTGATGQFTFAFDDVNGYQDISYLWVDFFSVSPTCQIYVYPGNGELNLTGDPGASSPPPVYIGTPGSTASNSACSISSSGSSVTGSGNQLLVTLAVNFFTSFGGAHRIEASVGGSTTVPVGTWIVPSAEQPGVTIQANTVGAPFSLDNGSIYTAPATFYWPAGSQHTINWLSTWSGQTNSRYVFQSWTDGGSNPRTITVPSVSATYTADVTAQYQLSVTDSPAGAGTVSANPTSSDGFYDSGTSVSLTAAPASGYYFGYFSGDVTGNSSPQTIAMTAPRNVSANYYCDYQFDSTLPDEAAPGGTSGDVVWWAGAGCAGTAASNASWLMLGPAAMVGQLNIVPFTVGQNTGASRSAALTFSGNQSYSYQMNITQDAAGSDLPSVSVSPASGSGDGAVFSLVVSDAGGYQSVNWLTAGLANGWNSPQCEVYVSYNGQNSWMWLLSDSGSTYLGPLNLPTSQVLSNSSCTLNGATSSVSGSGNLLTVKLGLDFTPAFAGARYIFGYASASTVSSPWQALGTWTATSANPALSIAKTHSGDFTQGQAGATYTLTVSNGASNGPSSGTVTVTENPPAALTLASMSGAGWSCAANTCTRSNVLNGGSSYPAITVTVNVASNAPSQVVNQATVSGGGSASASASDPTPVNTTAQFNDVPPGATYFDAANLMFQEGVTTGCVQSNSPQTREYCPDDNVTRQEMAAFIVRAVTGSVTPAIYNTTPYFNDVTVANNNFFPHIQKMMDLGITTGCSQNPPLFCPTDTIPRWEMAMFMIRARLTLYGASFSASSTPYFTDVPANVEGNGMPFPYVQRAYEEAVTHGCGSNPLVFCPDELVTRGQMASFIMRALFNETTILGPSGPYLAAVTPDAVAASAGNQIAVTITGANTSFQTGDTVTAPSGMLGVSNVVVNSATSITATLTVNANAVAGPQALVVTTGGQNLTLPLAIQVGTY